MYKRGKTDDNASPIVEALRKVGAVVWFIEGAHGSAGVPDLLVGYKGRTYLLEVKMEKGQLSEAQKRFIETWAGAKSAVVRNVQEALEAIGALGRAV